MEWEGLHELLHGVGGAVPATTWCGRVCMSCYMEWEGLYLLLHGVGGAVQAAMLSGRGSMSCYMWSGRGCTSSYMYIEWEELHKLQYGMGGSARSATWSGRGYMSYYTDWEELHNHVAHGYTSFFELNLHRLILCAV